MHAVLQVLCENQSTNTHSTQFMVRTGEGSVLYLYTKFEADSSIRLKIVIGPKIFKIGSSATPIYGPYVGRVRLPSLYQI